MSAPSIVRLRVSTALGEFLVEASARGVRSVRPVRAGDRVEPPPTLEADALRHAQAAADALRRYAEGERAPYDGPFDLTAPPFERAVWERLRTIPFGATTTYGAIASAVGVPGEARAVGAAVGANPVCVLVPCHRVVAADGSLRGFAWGLDLKRRLLAHEGSGALVLFEEPSRA